MARQNNAAKRQNIGIIVTRPKGQSQNFINRLKNGGYSAFDLPGISIVPTRYQNEAIETLSQVAQYDYCLFTSPNSVKFGKRLKLNFNKIKAFISIGSGTENALKPYLRDKTIITAPKPYTSEALVETLTKQGMKDQSVLIISGEGGRRLLDQAINDLGGKGLYCDVYRREAPQNLDVSAILDFKNSHPSHELYLTISSQEAFNNLLPILNKSGGKSLINGIFVGSERLKTIVESAGFNNIIVAKSALENDLWQAIEAQFSSQAVVSDAPLTITSDNNKELSMSKEQNQNDVATINDSTNQETADTKRIENNTDSNQRDKAAPSRRSRRKNRQTAAHKTDDQNLSESTSTQQETEDNTEQSVVTESAPSMDTETTSSTESHSGIDQNAKPAKAGQSLTYLALLIALGGLGLGGFAYYKGAIEQEQRFTGISQSVEADKNTINSLKSTISTLENELKTLKETADKASQTTSGSLQDQVALVAKKQESLNQSLANSAKGLQSQIDTLKKAQQSLTEKGDSIDKIATVSDQAITIANNFDKKLAEQELAQSVVLNEAKELISTIKNITDLEMLRTTEVDYLLKVAIQKVQFDKDYQIAGQLLSSALDRLNQINSINFSETKRLLADNIAELKTLKPVDLVTVTNKLEKVAALVQQAPLKDDSALMNLKNKIFNQGAPEGDSWTDKLVSSMKHLIVIEDKRTEVPELMAKEDRFFLSQNIQLELTAAKVAILQDQYAIFDHSLETVQSWIKTYFDEDNADVREAIQQLQWLLDAKLEVTPPNIERTLTDFEATLRAYKGA